MDDSFAGLLHPGEERAITPALLGKPDGGLLHFTNLSTGLNGSVEVCLT